MEIIAYVFAGVFTLLMSACAIGPMILSSMSKEEREDAGIVIDSDN